MELSIAREQVAGRRWAVAPAETDGAVRANYGIEVVDSYTTSALREAERAVRARLEVRAIASKHGHS